MNLAQQLSDYIRACCTGIWLQSYEHQDAIAEIAQLCRSENWRLMTWNLETGLRIQGADETSPEQSTDPLVAIRSLRSFAAEDSTSILILQNAHRFLQSAEIAQALEQQLIQGKQHRTFVVVLAPGNSDSGGTGKTVCRAGASVARPRTASGDRSGHCHRS